MAFSSVILAAAETALPAVIGRAVDAVIGSAPRSWLVWAALLVGLLIAVDVVDDLANGAMTAISTAWLRLSLIRHLLRVRPRANGLPVGDIANRVVGNTADAGRIGPELLSAGANVVPALGGTIALGLINIWLLVTFLAALPFGYLIVRSFAKDISGVIGRYLRHQGQITARMTDAVSGARTIAAAGTQDHEANRILEPLPELHDAGMAMWRVQASVLTKDAFLVPILEVAVLAVAGLELSHGSISPGEMLAAVQYVLLAANFMSAVGLVSRLAASRAAADRAAEIAAETPVSYGSRRLPRGNGHLQFRSVTVRAGDEVLLDRLDLDIAPGTLVAVVGPSGSGKSTLTALIGRLTDPEEGDVLLDGAPLRQLSRSALRRAVAYGFERPQLIGQTVADAIAFGQSRPSGERIVAAGRDACADAFIRLMPSGYATPLSEAPMSGGEIQRIGLARAFAHGSRVLVLDDVASRLDSMTDEQITRVLTSSHFQQTRVVVAHRLSTAARSDLVVWLERGRPRAVGTHVDLWADPRYRRLFEADRSSTRRAAAIHANGAAP